MRKKALFLIITYFEKGEGKPHEVDKQKDIDQLDWLENN